MSRDSIYVIIKEQLCRWNEWQGNSINKRIFSSIIIVATMSLIVKFTGMVKELVIADYFGTGRVVDAYLFAYLLPSFAINILAGSFSSALMPTYIRIRDNKSVREARKLYASAMLIGIIFLIISTILLAILAPMLLSFLGTGFDQKTMMLTQRIFYWFLPIILLTGTSHLLAIMINAGENFAAVALTPAITPLCSIILLVILTDKLGIYALVVGIVLGACMELAMLIIVTIQKDLFVYPYWGGMTTELKTSISQYLPMLMGAFLMSGTMLVDQSMAAMLERGSVATLNYANKVVAMILGIGAMAVGTAVLPHFSRIVVSEDWTILRHTFVTYVRLIVLITVPFTVFLFIFSDPIISFLFERGAFSADDAHLVAQTQACYLLQIPFYMLGILGVRLISVLERNDILMKIAIINMVLNIIGNYVFMKWFGVAGIALSTSFVYFVSTGIVFTSLNEILSTR